MDILKYGVLPFFALLHAFVVLLYVTGNLNTFLQFSEVSGSFDERTEMEEHFIVMNFGAGGLALLYGCVVGILYEDSHFRGHIAMIHFLYFGVDVVDVWDRKGFDLPGASFFTLLALAGVIAHARDVGFFTKDKKEKTKAK